MSQLTDNLNLIASIKSDIKSAIENKGVDMTGVSFPGYASKIGEISGGGGVKPSGTLEISENGVYNVYTYASASVDVHPSASLSETYISNGNYNITGEFNGGVITVDVPAPQFVTETLNVSANGTYTPGEGIDGYSQVVVDVPQSVTVGIPENEYTENTFIISNLNNSAGYVAEGRFRNYSYLETVTLSLCSDVSGYAFQSCYNLINVSLPVCTSMGYSAFTFCSSLRSVYLPILQSTSGFAFSMCKSLETIELPSLSQLNYGVFKSCSALTTVSVPVCGLVSGSAFDNCQNFSTITLPKCSVIKEQFNFRSTILNQITLGYSGLCTLSSTDAFTNTPIAAGTGSIYVPASLVDAYKSATNWSYFSTQIFPIPE